MINKNNVPYYITGTLATFTLLASGVFAAAPYIGFLAPVAALNVGLPFIIGGAVFSAVAIALSYAAISKNKTISEKEAQLADEKSKVEAKEEEISKQKIEINKKNEEINNPKEEIEKFKHKKTFVPQVIKDIKTACEEAVTTVKEACSSGRIFDIAKRRLKDVYDIIPSTESVRNLVPSLKTVGWIAVGTGATYIAANRGFTGANNSSNAVSNSVNSVRNHTLSSNSSFTCPNPTMQRPYELQCELDEYRKTLADSKKFAKNNFGISEEDEPQWSKNLTNHTYSNNTASKTEANPTINLFDTTLSFPPVTSIVVAAS
ncbi:hypothetical protein [Wolbachia endosymbiont (group A) of Beris morrisii]|uniref:hypothetical protein n=1 Tax=Wolbachia endosymbiont (group A) of Beris morrisii TaxID=3066139 RepID=UPI00333E93A5